MAIDDNVIAAIAGEHHLAGAAVEMQFHARTLADSRCVMHNSTWRGEAVPVPV
jgi:hypothetical protein